MHAIFSVLYCFDRATRPGQQPILRTGHIEGYDEPRLIDACMADMESGKLKVELLTPIGTSESFTIPHQEEDHEVFFQTPFVFSPALKGMLDSEKDKNIFLFSDYDDEDLSFRYITLFSVNSELDNNSIEGLSDGLVIHKVESFDALVKNTFAEIYLLLAAYNKETTFSENRLSGLREAIFEGSHEGPNAKTFHEIFSAPECRHLIIELLDNSF